MRDLTKSLDHLDLVAGMNKGLGITNLIELLVREKANHLNVANLPIKKRRYTCCRCVAE
jgi:hypothetical protein